MANIEATVSWWSQKTEPIKINSIAEFNSALKEAQESSSTKSPIIFVILAHGCVLTFPIGRSKSFVQISSAPHEPPYWITVGNREATGYFVFQVNGEHYTEIPRRNIVFIHHARKIARQFLLTGQRPTDVEWEAT
jgi:hypothetical protein